MSLFFGLGVVLTVGFVSARFLVSDGLDRFTGKGLTVAQDALVRADIGCLDHPAARILGQKVRVVEVDFGPGHCSETDLEVNPEVHPDYLAVLRAYTIFGIPTVTISVSCGEVVCGV